MSGGRNPRPYNAPVAAERSFPAGFLWGTATAAHQVEGENTNSDWWEFEQEPGRIHGGDRSGLACDHYRLYREDFRLLRKLNQNAHRLSIEWARVSGSGRRIILPTDTTTWTT